MSVQFSSAATKPIENKIETNKRINIKKKTSERKLKIGGDESKDQQKKRESKKEENKITKNRNSVKPEKDRIRMLNVVADFFRFVSFYFLQFFFCANFFGFISQLFSH